MKISILIPWRTDNGQRQRVWNHLRPLWDKTEFEISVGEDDSDLNEPFNCAKALNRAAAKATGDVLVTMGADYYPLPSSLKYAAHIALREPGWCAAFDSVRYLSRDNTEMMLLGDVRFDDSRPVTNWPTERIDHGCQGITAVRAELWRKVGGMDERYRGWGWEDTAFRRTLYRAGSLYVPERTFLPGLALWHDESHRDLTYNNPNRRLFESEG